MDDSLQSMSRAMQGETTLHTKGTSWSHAYAGSKRQLPAKLGTCTCCGGYDKAQSSKIDDTVCCWKLLQQHSMGTDDGDVGLTRQEWMAETCGC